MDLFSPKNKECAPDKMPTPGCDCPLCVLCYADLQICDLRVTFTNRKKNKLHFSMTHLEQPPLRLISANKQIESSIIALVYDAHCRRLDMGDHFLVEKPEYTLNISRLSEKEYKFCFHSNLNPVPDEETDPLPMD